MNESNEFYEASEVNLNKKRELPLVWLLPICALIVTSWLIYKSVSEKGPVITITFPTADGLEVDKTKIKYLNVDVGKVTAISINDSNSIQLTAQMDKDADDYMTEKTQFWVVRPQIGIGGVSGLSTLLSGNYIAIKPEKGKKTNHFVGLKVPPPILEEGKGKRYTLKAREIGSMRSGTPISFHGIQAGEVLDYQLSDNADSINLSIFIRAPYDQFVRKNTRFWIDSGIDLTTTADGISLRTGPLVSLLSGGIAFRTDEHDSEQDIESEYTNFELYENYDDSTQVVYRKTIKVAMFFNGSVRGLAIGAPVLLRGIPIGKVTDFFLELDEKTSEVRIPVLVEIEPDRVKKVNQTNTSTEKEKIERLIKEGLRAQLQTGNLLTGQLFVALDFFQKSKVTYHTNDTGYPEFPTVPTSFDQITHSAQIIMDKLSKIPLDKIGTQANETLVSLQGTSKAASDMLKTAKTTLTTANGTLTSADKAMNSAHLALSTFEPGSTTQYQLNNLLQELTRSASSLKQLTDYLEHNPDALIRGKIENKK